MPRRGRGSRTQAPQVSSEVTYGEGADLIESQRQIPLPVATSDPSPTAPGPAPGAMVGTVARAAGLPDDQAALLAAAQMAPPTGGVLTRPTDRPSEPLLAPVDTRRPPMRPAHRRRPGGVAATYFMIAEATGDPVLLDMAERAARRGL